MDGGSEKVVRREGCIGEERCTQHALPEEVAGSNLCLEPVTKWKVAVLFLSSHSPACCYSELTLATCVEPSRGQQQTCHQTVSTNSVFLGDGFQELLVVALTPASQG